MMTAGSDSWEIDAPRTFRKTSRRRVLSAVAPPEAIVNKTILWFCAAAAALAAFQPVFAATASGHPGQRTEPVSKAMCKVEVRRKSPSESSWVFGH